MIVRPFPMKTPMIGAALAQATDPAFLTPGPPARPGVDAYHPEGSPEAPKAVPRLVSGVGRGSAVEVARLNGIPAPLPEKDQRPEMRAGRLNEFVGVAERLEALHRAWHHAGSRDAAKRALGEEITRLQGRLDEINANLEALEG